MELTGVAFLPFDRASLPSEKVFSQRIRISRVRIRLFWIELRFWRLRWRD